MRLSVACLLAVSVFLWAGGTKAARAADKPKTVWLDQLDLKLSECGWQQTLAKRSVGGNPIRLRGKTFERGIGTHSPGRFAINVNGATKFTALGGIDDEVNGSGRVEMIVKGDGKVLWTSGIITGKDAPKEISVDLAGVKKLELIVTEGGDGFGNDHTDWADAKFEVAGAAPAAARPPVPSGWDIMAREISDMKGRFKQYESQAFRRDSLIFETDRDPADVVLRRTAALLAHLKEMKGTRDLAAEQADLDRLKAESQGMGSDEGRRAMFDKAQALNRKVALSNPLLNFDKILFLKKQFLPGQEGLGNHMCDQYFGFHALREGGLFVLENPFSDKPAVRDILADSVCETGRFKGAKLPPGGYLSPELSYDGKTVAFAFTEADPTRYKWTETSTYHLFKVNLDGTHLEQLTDGVWNDFHPTWMPNGRICFISERRGGFGRCHGRPVPVYTLHSCNADGTDIVCLCLPRVERVAAEHRQFRHDRLHAVGLRGPRLQPGPPSVDHDSRRPRRAGDPRQLLAAARRAHAVRDRRAAVARARRATSPRPPAITGRRTGRSSCSTRRRRTTR